jgi:L-amino acid N-acyltransferase YncA
MQGMGLPSTRRRYRRQQKHRVVRVHEKLGFQHSGVLRDVGFKFDRWIDTVLMQLPL